MNCLMRSMTEFKGNASPGDGKPFRALNGQLQPGSEKCKDPHSPMSETSHARYQNALASLIFLSRWLQAPLYFGLIVAQGVYVYHFLIELIHLLTEAAHIEEKEIMLTVLGLIDVVMIANLLIMVIVGGYETFVSRLQLGGPSGPAGMALARQCGRAKSETRDGVDRHFLDPSAENFYRNRPAGDRSGRGLMASGRSLDVRRLRASFCLDG